MPDVGSRFSGVDGVRHPLVTGVEVMTEKEEVVNDFGQAKQKTVALFGEKCIRRRDQNGIILQ